MRTKIIRLVGSVLIISGLFLFLGSLFINVRQQAMKKEALEAFKEQIAHNESFFKEVPIEGYSPDEENISAVTQELDKEAEKPSEGDVLCILRIPCIDSENPVREGVSGGVLADSLGHEPETAMVGDKGNCVIAGHRNYTFGQYFNRLNEVSLGDMIYVDTASETYSYSVTDIKVVEPEDLSVLEATDTEILTLYTCTPLYLATHRLVIVADRIY
ncbi:MAG: class D sortase [Lachnospiraceae bacterium]|nr:class D sortase [Lachnospiraceae bacterium]